MFIVPDLVGFRYPELRITIGPDGNIWTKYGRQLLGRHRRSSGATEGATSRIDQGARPWYPGPDANLWLVASMREAAAALVGRVVPNAPGSEVLTEFPVTTQRGHPP